MLRRDAPIKRLNKPPNFANSSYGVKTADRTDGKNISSSNDTIKRLNVALERNNVYPLKVVFRYAKLEIWSLLLQGEAFLKNRFRNYTDKIKISCRLIRTVCKWRAQWQTVASISVISAQKWSISHVSTVHLCWSTNLCSMWPLKEIQNICICRIWELKIENELYSYVALRIVRIHIVLEYNSINIPPHNYVVNKIWRTEVYVLNLDSIFLYLDCVFVLP